jgi:hypothetical protein
MSHHFLSSLVYARLWPDFRPLPVFACIARWHLLTRRTQLQKPVAPFTRWRIADESTSTLKISKLLGFRRRWHIRARSKPNVLLSAEAKTSRKKARPFWKLAARLRSSRHGSDGAETMRIEGSKNGRLVFRKGTTAAFTWSYDWHTKNGSACAICNQEHLRTCKLSTRVSGFWRSPQSNGN